MSQDQWAAAAVPVPRDSIVEWGADEAPPRRLDRIVDLLSNDRRPVHVIAALGGVALFACLVGEWQAVVVYDGGPDGSAARRFTAGVAALGGLGTAFLVGVLALVTATAVVLFGPPAGRRRWRLVGLSLTASVGALLVAIAVQLDQLGSPFNGYFYYPPEQRQPDVSVGRGLQAAFLGVALLGLALLLAGRLLRDDAPDKSDLSPKVGAEAHPGSRWRARRPRAPQATAPLDLTVGPAAPFAHSPDDRSAR